MRPIKLKLIALLIIFIFNSISYAQNGLNLTKLYGKPIETTETTKVYFVRDHIIKISVETHFLGSPKYTIFPVKPLKVISSKTTKEILTELFPQSEGFKEKNTITFQSSCNGSQISLFENQIDSYKIYKSFSCSGNFRIIIEKKIFTFNIKRKFSL